MKYIFACVTLATLVVTSPMVDGSAQAADLPLKAPVLAPPTCIWCGWYVGLNAGDAFESDSSVRSVGIPIGAPGAPVGVPGLNSAVQAATGNISLGTRNAFIGGGQVGYNWQFGAGLVGIETDIQGLSQGRSGTLFNSAPTVGFPDFRNATLSATNSVDYLGTFRGRFGYTLTPTLLLYGTGGLAYGGVRSSTSILQQPVGAGVGGVNTPYSSAGSFSGTRVGWTAGLGAEWMFWSRWSAKIEYLYYDLGSVTYSPGTLTSIQTPAGTTFYSLTSQSSTRFDGQVIRAGINLHF